MLEVPIDSDADGGGGGASNFEPTMDPPQRTASTTVNGAESMLLLKEIF
jgi:hypothetical protein